MTRQLTIKRSTSPRAAPFRHGHPLRLVYVAHVVICASRV